jgi:plastocyanin
MLLTTREKLDKGRCRMRRASFIPVLLAIAGLAFAGCGGGDDDSTTATSGGGASTAPATTGGGGATAAGPVAVSMRDIAFAPTEVRVRVGQEIDWTNDDSVDHNVTATSGADFRSDDFGQGGTYSYTPTRAGTIDYVCTLHPGMDATIVVTR